MQLSWRSWWSSLATRRSCWYEAVIISSEDTDVFILLLAFDSSINSRLFRKCGNQTRTKLVDIDKITSTLGDHVCKGVIGLHAYTGCDTVSAFAGKGKVNSVKILKSDKCTQDAFAQLGQNWTLSEDLFDKMEKFTCALYTPGGKYWKNKWCQIQLVLCQKLPGEQPYYSKSQWKWLEARNN